MYATCIYGLPDVCTAMPVTGEITVRKKAEGVLAPVHVEQGLLVKEVGNNQSIMEITVEP